MKEKYKQIKMMKMTPYKIISVFAGILVLLLFAAYFISDHYKTELNVVRLFLAATLFIFAMMKSGAIEQEKIELEKLKQN